MKHSISQEFIKLSLTSFSLLFVLSSILSNWEQLARQSLDTLGWICLVSSILITCLSILVNGLAWKYFIDWLGFKTNNNIIIIFVKTNIFKYLPGGIWHFVARIRGLKRYLNISNSIIAVCLEPFIMLVAASCCIVFGDFNFFLKLLSILPLFLFSRFFRTLLLEYLNKFVSTKLSKINQLGFIGFEDSDLRISSNSYPFKSLIVEVGFVFLRFFGFWLCLKAFSISANIVFFDWLAFFSFAWIVGLIVPAAPGGIGVFESILLLLIGNNVAEAPFLASLLSYRLVSTISDILSFALISLNRPIDLLKIEKRFK